jgi:diguanylate cyclase (GGDEF)-like protein
MNSSILIVDDSPYLLKLVRAALYGEPVEIHSVEGGEAAISTAASLRPSLILLDVDLPEMDGFEVCRRLKANPATESIPVLFLTADVAVGDQVKGLNLGAAGYITKPFKAEDLRARVRGALRAQLQLENMAMIDDLTRLWNQRYLDLHLPGFLSMARRTNRPLTCVIANVDGLEKINQAHGEAIGNQVLRTVATIFAGQGRAQDTFCYLGNGRFLALLPLTSRAGAVQLADRARVEIERSLKSCDGVAVSATCSFGVADTQTDGESSLLDRADVALYCAKQSGRNAVSISRPAAAEACGVG